MSTTQWIEYWHHTLTLTASYRQGWDTMSERIAEQATELFYILGQRHG